jgi:hypothetical protein
MRFYLNLKSLLSALLYSALVSLAQAHAAKLELDLRKL